MLATSMDMMMPAQAVQQIQEPELIRRPRFKRGLLEKESFVDPAKEMALLVPEKTVLASFPAQLALEASVFCPEAKRDRLGDAPPSGPLESLFKSDPFFAQQKSGQFAEGHRLAAAKKQRKAEAFFYSVYETLLAMFEKVKKRLGGRKARQALTRRGEEALEQLRYLAMLCDATECRTPDEVLAAESAFGEAYYEIKTLSSNLGRMREEEQAHHVERYSRHMAKLLSATQS